MAGGAKRSACNPPDGCRTRLRHGQGQALLKAPGDARRINRQIGTLANLPITPDGQVLARAEWQARRDEWLPSPEDRAFVASLMGRVVEPGRFAGWIAPPAIGINRQPVDFEYVRFN